MDSIPDPNTYIYNLQYDIVQDLIKILNKNNAWKEVANAFDIILQQEYNLTPSEELIKEIGQRMCTVNILKTILTHCHQYEALALFKSFEALLLIEQPSDTIKECIIIPHNGQLKLTCKATGIPLPKYQWFHNKKILEYQSTAELSIESFSLENDGYYECIISQEGSESISTKPISVECAQSPIEIIESPPKQLILQEGAKMQLSVNARADRPLKFQWFKDLHPLLNEQTNSLKIHCLKLSDAGHFTCNISNSLNQVRIVETQLLVSKPLSTPKINPNDKVALLIGNDTYDHLKPLKTPRRDVSTIAKILTNLNFKVLTLINLSLTETHNAIRLICQMLPLNAYVFFYFAGHGYYFHEYFMLPTDSSDIYSHNTSICEKHLIRKLQTRHPRLIFTILDMCLIIPEKENMIHSDIGHPEEYLFTPARNLVRAYATSNYLRAYEYSDQMNGIYVNHLKNYLGKSLSIDKILNKIASDMAKEALEVRDLQIPSYNIDLADVEQISLSDNILTNNFTRYSTLITPPPSTFIVFEQSKLMARVNFRPLDGTILNAVEIEVTGIPKKYSIKLDKTFQDLKITLQKIEENYIIYLYNLQKLKSNSTLSVHLYSSEDKSFMDWAIIDVGLPFVAKESLWYTPQKDPNE